MPREIIKSETILDNEFFKITKDSYRKKNGSIVKSYYTIHRPEVAVICAITKKNEIILIRQYRHPVKNIDLELPAGYIENHENNIRLAAERELLEETGYAVEKMIKIQTSYASAGLMSNKINFFIGFNAKKIKKPELDESEEIMEVFATAWDKTIELLEKEEIKDMASVTGILLAKRYLEKINHSNEKRNLS
ncbi:NUDIX domain-containing protein [Candidatus Peregrinibacteria bacterium]|nr:NUDIX domain-containing protein [Candidatus Peregrinibacteria bacterium]